MPVSLSIRSCIARLHPTGKKYLEKFSCSAVIVRAFNTLFAPPCVEAPLITLIWPCLWLISLEEWFKAVKVLIRIKSFVAALERQIQKSHSRLSHDFVVEWHWLIVGSTKRKKADSTIFKFVLVVWKIYTTLRKNVVTIRLLSESALKN